MGVPSRSAPALPRPRLVARLVSTRERAQALAAASAARQRQLRHCRDRGSSRAAREHEGASSRTLAARCAAREHEGASSGTRSCISRSSAAQLGSACAPTAHSHTRLLRWCCCCCRVTISSGTAETAVCMPLDQMVLLLLPSQSVLALPRPQLVNGRAVTISSGTAETAVCMPLLAAAHSEPHSQQLGSACAPTAHSHRNQSKHSQPH